ncbi:MAG: hypothetical protein R3Y43_05895 [Alphaproteobacteria bacterium]
MKKFIKKFIKLIFIFCVIAYPFTFISQKFFMGIFNFNYLSPFDWDTIPKFVQSGGVIKGTKDYWLLITLAFNPILFLIIWRYFYKKGFLKLFLYFINRYNARMIKKYGENTKRIVLKNLGRASCPKLKIDEMKPDLNASKQTSQNIREAVREALTNN